MQVGLCLMLGGFWVWPTAAALALALIGGAYLKGRSDGGGACALRASEEARRTEQEFTREQIRQSREIQHRSEQLQVLLGELEKLAAKAPDAEETGLSGESASRLNRLSLPR